ncbi:MAG: glycosyl hydrolase 115 family protein [Treponema sp.]|nr:glycosyl hydrolase 115 family protein [Treponema sp.]
MFKLDGNIKFVCAEDEFSGVKKIADKVCLDVERVTGKKPVITAAGTADGQPAEPAVLFASLEKSSLAEKLAAEGGLSAEVSKITGKRECYVFAVRSDKIIIIGSDKRGTIYGLFHLSELMGVSPLVDWAGVLPAHRDTVELEEGLLVSREPSVRFRGFFINDEWPAYGNFTGHNFGGFNAKMYEHVFELLLRLKGNYLWPAMWSAQFSLDGPGLANAELADEMGVIMGASHHEPCCRNGEEYRHVRGPGSIYGDAWNFRSNEKGITKFWEDGLKRNGKFENVITVGMRGEADTAIMQNATLADNINLLRDVLKTQNRLIRENVNQDLDKVPRMLALYKEVEPYFYGDKHTKGLMDDPELEGVTLMLCDDNHGNLRTVPTEHMRSHKGGYGMYYHFDYHGWPYSYEWLNTNYLPKAREQMSAAYEFGIRDLWIVNVGDILTNEFPLSYFLNLAYDYEKYNSDTKAYSDAWFATQFPYFSAEEQQEISDIVYESNKLANMRRTECLRPDTFHPVNFGESDLILSRAKALIERTKALRTKVPAEQDAGFFSQVYLPVVGTMNVLLMQLYSGKNHWFAKHNAMVANVYADKVRECVRFDKELVDETDKIGGGRFFGMAWSEHFGFNNWCEAANSYPVYEYVEPTRKKRNLFWIDGAEFTTTGQDWTIRDLYLDAFKNPDCSEACIKIANCNEEGCEYTVTLGRYDNDDEKRWINGSIVKDEEGLGQKAYCIDTVLLTIDREKLAKDSNKTDVITITGNDGHGAKILVKVHVDAAVPDCNFPAGTFVQTGNYVSMEAPHFVRSSGFDLLEGYGKTLGAVKAKDVITTFAPDAKNSPFVEYAFALDPAFVEKTGGPMAFDVYLNPSNPAYKDNKLQFVAEINGVKLLKDVVDAETFAVGDNQFPWGDDITNNIRIATVYADCKAGLNLLKISPVTPNIVIEKIVIHEANTKMPSSYLGAPETFFL